MPENEAPKVVWIACRATPKCEGKQAVVVRKVAREGGGSSTRFQCKTCGRPFHVTI